jgi:hypothetical protein
MGSHKFETAIFSALEKFGIPEVKSVNQATKYTMLALELLPRDKAEDTVRYMLDNSPLSYNERERVRKAFAIS